MIHWTMAMELESVAESKTPHAAVIDCEHEHRFAEHEHEVEPGQSDEAERKWRSAGNRAQHLRRHFRRLIRVV